MGKFVQNIDHFFDFCKENEVKFGSKLELERTEKTDVSTIAYKVNYTEKSLKEDNTKSLVYENEIKFGGAKIEDNPSRKINQ